jgi:hypothetical protein
VSLSKLLFLASFAIAVAAPAPAAKRSEGKSAGPSVASKSAVKSAVSNRPKAPGPLDQDAVRKLYGDGDFDPAINLLEAFQKSHSRFTREESLMVYKYLGVMYSADLATREKGKNYFYKLLKIDPDAKILDLYVSIVVQEIFKSTLDELMGQSSIASKRQAGPASGQGDGATPTNGMPGRRDPEAPRPKPEVRKSHAAYWWIGGAALAVGVGGYFFYSQNAGKAPDKEIGVAF